MRQQRLKVRKLVENNELIKENYTIISFVDDSFSQVQ